MPSIRILFFAKAKDLLKQSEAEIDLPSELTINQLFEWGYRQSLEVLGPLPHWHKESVPLLNWGQWHSLAALVLLLQLVLL